MSALKRLAPLAPRLTASNLCRQQQRGFAASGGSARGCTAYQSMTANLHVCFVALQEPVLIIVRSACAVGHGDSKVNCWEQPTNISNWKEEHVRYHITFSATQGKYAIESILCADCVCCLGMLGCGHIQRHQNLWGKEGECARRCS